MSTHSLVLPISLSTLSRACFVVVAMVVRFGKLLVRGMKNRREAAALARLDGYMLADIGLTRSDLRDAAAAPLWEDPTALLRARALERRLGRNGVSLGLPFNDQDED
jgi:uncharacterized protein YjiS (DUF1127 family)